MSKWKVPVHKETGQVFVASTRYYTKEYIERTFDWLDPWEFELEAAPYRSFKTRSSAGVTFKDESGNTWPILVNDLIPVLRAMHNGKVRGRFGFEKRGVRICVVPLELYDP